MAVPYYETLQPFLVLDKMLFRNSNKNAAANTIVEAQRLNCQVLVIDTVFVEILRAHGQGKEWKDQFEKDFRDWTRHPDLLCISQGLGELLRLERDTGKPALSSLVDAEMTQVVRDMIRDLAVAGKARLTKYDARVAAHLAKLTAPGAMLDPDDNLARLHTRVDYWHAGKAWHNQGEIRKMIQDEVHDESATEYHGLGLAATSDLVLGGLELALTNPKNNYPPAVAKILMSAPSFTLFRFVALEALALYYYAQGRKSPQLTDAGRELNQTLDMAYLAYGLACQQLRTAENLGRRLDAGLRRALAHRWPPFDTSSTKPIEDRQREWAYYAWISRSRPTGDDWTDWFNAVATITS